jgi:hypothetical protein
MEQTTLADACFARDDHPASGRRNLDRAVDRSGAESAT